jgi:hypothetical protein
MNCKRCKLLYFNAGLLPISSLCTPYLLPSEACILLFLTIQAICKRASFKLHHDTLQLQVQDEIGRRRKKPAGHNGQDNSWIHDRSLIDPSWILHISFIHEIWMRHIQVICKCSQALQALTGNTQAELFAGLVSRYLARYIATSLLIILGELAAACRGQHICPKVCKKKIGFPVTILPFRSNLFRENNNTSGCYN